MRTTSGSGASASKAGEDAGDTVGTRGPVSTGHGVRDSTPGPTAAVPPSTMSRSGPRRSISSFTASGTQFGPTKRIGPGSRPPSAPPASASGNVEPDASSTAGTPGENAPVD